MPSRCMPERNRKRWQSCWKRLRKEKLAVLTHGFRARQAQGDSEAAPSDEPSKQAAAEPQPKEEEVD